jgi:putative nucleotidyltransferase with HDIG domain
MLHLRIIRAAGNQDAVSIADPGLPYTVGRDSENHLHIGSTAVSRFHAVLVAENGHHYVQDMDSTNGTFLNGKPIRKAKIAPGDKITIANIDILVEGAPVSLRQTTAPLDLTVSINDPIPSDSTITVKNPTEELFFEDLFEGGPSPVDARSHRSLEVLYRADKIARDIEDFGQMLENLMDLILEVIPASRGYIFLVNRDTGKLNPYVRRAPDSISDDTEIVVSNTILKAAVGEKESLLSNDALVDERFVHSRSISDLKVRSAMCAPLVNRGKVLGIIYVDSNDKSNLYSKDDLALLSAMALKAGISLDNARLYDDQRSLFYNAVETLVRAIQARDPYTSGHSARVSRYSLLIAEKLNLSTKEKHQLYLAAMLHDIGKIGIPDGLLNRKGKLTDEEIQHIRNHVTVGAQMLQALGEMHPIVPLILHHHEAWDGSGYPDGLSGTQIPLMSRILSVADTYDAMTSNRPYRTAMSGSEAVEELKRCAGLHFDPDIVDIFLRILDEQATAIVNLEPQPVI